MFAVIDTETTGFSPKRDRIIEVGVVILDAEGNITRQWETLINPGRSNMGATFVHHIEYRDVVGVPRFSAYAGRLARLLSNQIVVGHNISYDWRMITAEFARVGIEPQNVETLCTMKAAKALGHKPAKLDDVCKTYGIEIGESHTALADAIATAKILPRVVDLTQYHLQAIWGDEGENGGGWWPELKEGERPASGISRHANRLLF